MPSRDRVLTISRGSLFIMETLPTGNFILNRLKYPSLYLLLCGHHLPWRRPLLTVSTAGLGAGWIKSGQNPGRETAKFDTNASNLGLCRYFFKEITSSTTVYIILVQNQIWWGEIWSPSDIGHHYNDNSHSDLCKNYLSVRHSTYIVYNPYISRKICIICSSGKMARYLAEISKFWVLHQLCSLADSIPAGCEQGANEQN